MSVFGRVVVISSYALRPPHGGRRDPRSSCKPQQEAARSSKNFWTTHMFFGWAQALSKNIPSGRGISRPVSIEEFLNNAHVLWWPLIQDHISFDFHINFHIFRAFAFIEFYSSLKFFILAYTGICSYSAAISIAGPWVCSIATHWTHRNRTSVFFM